MTHQLCIASHRDNPPTALGGLKLCAGHTAALTEALTGPSAAEDPTIDAVWGLRWPGHVSIHGPRERAIAQHEHAHRLADDHDRLYSHLALSPRPELVCGDGLTWHSPRDYRPGGLVRDYTALTLRATGLKTGGSTPCAVYTTEPVLPVPDPVAEVRSQIRHSLAYWVGRHAEDGSTRPPASDAEPAVLAAWLAIHRDWAAARAWAGDYVSALTELRARARRLIDLPRAPRVAVAPCPEHGCDGVLWSAIREEHDVRPSLVQCNVDEGHQWDSTQWMRLGQRLRASGKTAA